MAQPLYLKAYGKVNLGLDVLRRREDGYHEVRLPSGETGYVSAEDAEIFSLWSRNCDPSAENIISTAMSSGVGLVSSLLFLWVVIWMMMSVERVFNNVWKVHKSRNFIKRLSFYLAVLVIAPFVVMLFFSGSISYTNLFDNMDWGIFQTEEIRSFVAWLIFYVIAALTFSAMYKFIPNYKVKYSHAFRAAVISAAAFTVLQYLYLETQVFVTRLNMVYGAVAAIPLFMFWLNFGWFIILFGAELSYAFQNVNNYNLE